jgi:hypothetical protein
MDKSSKRHMFKLLIVQITNFRMYKIFEQKLGGYFIVIGPN